jgi:hypothetical protein
MKFYLIVLVIVIVSYDNIFSQDIILSNSTNVSYDSLPNNSSFNFIKIGGQVLAGTIGGIIFSLPVYNFNPILSSIGWLAGSSLGVYLVGNIGDQKSSYLGTLLGGIVGSTLFIVSFNNSIKDGAVIYGAVLISIPFEILSYYLFQSDSPKSYNTFNSNIHIFNNSLIENNTITKPDFSVQLIKVSF